MCPLHDTGLLMTMGSCPSPGSNLELRRWQSALVFGHKLVPQTANGQLRDIIITRPLGECIVLSAKIKQTDAGATSRALPTGNRTPLKAWQENQKTRTLLWVFGKVVTSPVGENRSSLFISTLLYLTTLTLL